MVRLGLLVGLLVSLVPSRASAQAEITGTYIRYLGVRANGVMINSANHSMQYTETGAMPYSCDAFFPGLPVEELAIEATSLGTITAANTSTATAIPTVSGPTVAGRDIDWTGQYTNGLVGLNIQQRFSYGDTDRFATLTVTLTNNGSVALSNVYYQRFADPDFASCNIGTAFTTTNDVVRQPPTNSTALVVGAAGTPQVALGIGAEDSRARVHAATNITAPAPSAAWTTPRDPNGLTEDVGFAIVFREPTLSVGATTTFTIRYVWGPDQATVVSRFDGLACLGLPDGTACTGGTCRGGSCCTGCWDGASCLGGTATGACGAGGALCADCDDGNVCTGEACLAGACSNPPSPAGAACDDGLFCTLEACDGAGACAVVPRDCSDPYTCTNDSCNEASDVCVSSVDPGSCFIGSVCHASGALNPANDCLVCDPPSAATDWTPVATGTACDDGAFCTTPDTCDGAGSCGGSARDCSDTLACTTDSCDEAGDVCASVLDAGWCVVGGACFAASADDPANDCRSCNPTASTTSFSPKPAGVGCDDGSYCSVSDLCDGIGACLPGPARDCSDGLACTGDACDEAGDTCVSTPTTGCVIDGACVATGMVNPDNACEACLPPQTDADWSPRPAGEQCGDPSCTDGTFTPAPTCDGAGTCDPGTPESCDGAVCADPTSCDGSCDDDLECLETHFCAEDMSCDPDLVDGTACDRASVCESGFCVDGVCCESDCEGTCETGVCMPNSPAPHGGCDCRAGTGAGGSVAAALLALLALLSLRSRRR